MDVTIVGFPVKIVVRGFDQIGDVNVLMLKGEKGDKGDNDPLVITSSDINNVINSLN